MNVNGGPLDFVSALDNSQFGAAMREMRNDVARLTGDFQRQGSQIETFASRATAAAAGFFSTQAAAGFIKQMVHVRGEFQQIEIAFRTMLGSKEKADQLMAEAVKLAAITPFTLNDVAKGAKQLLAYGFAAGDITKELTKLGNIASGVGSQLGDIVYLYGTMKAGGRVTQVDLNQFAGRGIPIYDELAKVIGKTSAEVRAYVSAGKIGFPEVEKAFANMTGQGGKFFNLMQEQSKSLTGQLSNLSDAWDRMLNALGKSQEGIIGDGIQAAIELVDNYQKIIDIIELLVITYGSYRTALLITTTVTGGMSAVELIHYNILVMKDKLMGILTSKQVALAASTAAYTAVLAALVAVGYSLIQYQDAAEIAEDSLTEAKDRGSRAVETETEKINDLLKTIRNHNLSKREQKAAYDSLLQTTQGALDKYSQEDIAAGKGADAIAKYVDSVRKATEANQEFADYKGLQEQIDAINDKGIKVVSIWDQAAISFTNFFKAVKMAMSGNLDGLFRMMDKDLAFKDVTDEKKRELKGAQFQIVSANPDVKKRIDAEKAAKAAEEETKAKEILATKTAEQIAKEEAAAKKYNTLLEKRKDLEREILQDLAGARASALSEEDKAVAAINAKYDDRIAQLDKINAKLNPEDQSKAKVQVESARYIELGVAGVETIVGQYKEELDRKKQLFEEYEQARVDLGETKANEMYSKEIGAYKSYLDYLTNDVKSRKGDNTLLAIKKNEIVAPLIIESEAEARKKYNALLKENATYTDQVLVLTQAYNESILKLQGAENAGRRAVLTQGLQDDLNALGDNALQKTEIYKKAAAEAVLITKEQAAQQIKALNSILDSGVIPADQSAKIQSEIDRLKFTLKIGVDQGNLESLKNEFSRVSAELNATDENGNKIILSDDNYRAIIQRLAGIQLKINSIDNNGDGKITWGDKIRDQFDYLKGDAGKIAQGLSNDLGDLSSSFGELSGALGGNNTQAGYFLDTLSTITKAGQDAAGAFASFSSGDIIGGITKTISAVTSVLSIGKKVKEMNEAARKEVEDFYKNAVSGEREYQDLLKERELQIIRNNKVALQGIRDELALRQSQSKDYAKEAASIMSRLQSQQYIASETYKHGTWFRKAEVIKNMASLQGKSADELFSLLAQGKLENDTKALVERLKELEEKGYDAEQAIADLAKETSELFTGTTSDNLTNTLLDMFKNGKTGAQDLADFFKQTMDEAALSIFKNKVLAQAMESFYTEFDKAAQSGDELTSDEIARLNGLFTSLTGDALRKFEEFKKITGSDLTGTGTESSSNGGIKSSGITASQESVDVNNAIARSNYEQLKQIGLTALDHLQVARQGIDYLNKIEQHTFRGANNTDSLSTKLDQIITNTKPAPKSQGWQAVGG